MCLSYSRWQEFDLLDQSDRDWIIACQELLDVWLFGIVDSIVFFPPELNYECHSLDEGKNVTRKQQCNQRVLKISCFVRLR